MRSSPRIAPSLLAFVAAGSVLVGCGSGGHPTTAGPTSTVTTTAVATTGSPTPSVTAQPATTATPTTAAGSPLGSVQSATTAQGHTLGVVVAGVTQPSPTEVQARVELTADGPPATIHPPSDLHLFDTAGTQFGASLVTPPQGCPALAGTATVTAQAPIVGCVVFAVPSGTTPARITFTPDATSSSLTWRTS